MFRRLKKDILKDLPEMQHNVVSLPYDRKNEYKKAEKNFLSWLGQSHGRGAMVRAKRSQSLSKTGYLRRLIIEVKMPYVIEWITDFLEQSEEKLVLMGCHTSAIDLLCKHFGKICVRVDGTVPNAKRKLAVQRFQNDPKCRLFVGNIDAAGEGLTLTKSSTVAFFELDWVPAKIAQGAARVHRITQTKVCQIYYLIAKGTIEERIMRTIESKSSVLNQVLDGGKGEQISILDLLADEIKSEARKAKRTSLRLQ
jgi:SWI/SNF-related matrix-associated actin-dependent regulator 1 of chromatin subfamily A